MKKNNDNKLKLIALLIIVFTIAINANYLVKEKVDTKQFVKLQHYIEDNKADKNTLELLKKEIGSEYLKTIISNENNYEKKALKINGSYFEDGIKTIKDENYVTVILQDYYKPEIIIASNDFNQVKEENDAKFLITLNNTSQVIQNHQLIKGNLNDFAEFQGLNIEGTLINGDIKGQEALDWAFNNATSSLCLLLNEYNNLDTSGCQQDYQGATVIGYTSSYRLVFLNISQKISLSEIVTMLNGYDVKTAAIVSEGPSTMSVEDQILINDEKNSDTYFILRRSQ